MPKITSLYVWIVEDPDGGEGLPAIVREVRGRNERMPLISSTFEGITDLTAEVDFVRMAGGRPMRLCRFDLAAELDG